MTLQDLANNPQLSQLVDQYVQSHGNDMNNYASPAGQASTKALGDYLSSKGMTFSDLPTGPNGRSVIAPAPGDFWVGPHTGFWESWKDWAPAAAIPVGGAILSGLMGGSGAAASGGAGSSATDAASGILPSTTTAGGIGILPASTASGAVPAALGGAAAAGTAAGTLPSTQIGTGMLGAAPTSTATGNMAAGGIGNVISNLLSPGSLSNISKALGNYGQAQSTNRYVGDELTQKYNDQMMQAQALRNQNETDALKKEAITSYILGNNTDWKPPTIPGLNLPDYGFGPKASTPAQKAGASTLQAQLLARLSPGGSYTPTPPNLTPGIGENIGTYGSLVGTGLGALSSVDPNWPSQVGTGIGKAFDWLTS